jgi:hypothetical protein
MQPAGECAKPIEFRITKGPELKHRAEAKKMLKLKGITKTCNCPSLDACKCVSDKQKKRIRCQMKDASVKFSLQKELSYADLEESSESEVDINFTPAIGHACGKQVCQSYAGTQYDLRDLTGDGGFDGDTSRFGKGKGKGGKGGDDDDEAARKAARDAAREAARKKR